MLPITGYTDRLCARPGESIAFKISTTTDCDYSASLIRVVSGDPNPAGPGIVEHDLSDVFKHTARGRSQPFRLGSFAEVALDGSEVFADAIEAGTLSFGCRLWPTLPREKRQCIATIWDDRSDSGIALLVDQNRLILETHSDGQQVASTRAGFITRERIWVDLMLSLNYSSGEIRVEQRSHMPNLANSDSGVHTDTLDGLQLPHPTHLRFAALEATRHFDRFNGKIESPAFYSDYMTDADGYRLDPTTPGLLAAWDFSQEMTSQRIVDTGPNTLHGRLRQIPSRAMRGSNWNGDEHCWRYAPEQYAAIHFHDDDLYDCEWESDFVFTIPDDLASGVYAMQLRCDTGDDMLPFFVAAGRQVAATRIVYLAPTFTYTVYGNHARGNTDDAYRARVSAWDARPWTPDDHGEYGFSTYNFHRDGSGIAMASRLRPMITMRSGYVTFSEEFTGSGLRHFAADTHLLSWLEHEGFQFDVITDEDLHHEGLSLLENYDVVVTSSHPEYHTPQTHDALSQFTTGGGHLMYLGGNGFYWRVAVNPEVPGAVEIRRAETGIRAWAAEPGEYYHALDGGYGGTWRRNNRPPQVLTGVGFSGQGKFEGSHYRRNPDLDASIAQWVFAGIDDEILGDFGLSGGGAAGFEVDRVDYRLGTPEQTHILATSENHQHHFMLVPEEQLTHLYTWSGESTDNVDNLIRADLVYFETVGGGGVFSVGSITWCGSLPCNNYDNNISRLTANVLRRFSGTS